MTGSAVPAFDELIMGRKEVDTGLPAPVFAGAAGAIAASRMACAGAMPDAEEVAAPLGEGERALGGVHA